MANSVTVEVKGLSELGDKLRGLSRAMNLKIAGRATNAAAQPIKKQAKTNIQISPSVDTGALLKSVIVKKIPRSQTQYTSEHIVTVRGRGKTSKKTGKTQNAAPHAVLVEYGTVHMPAEPFLRPAFNQEKGFAVQAMKEKIEEAINKAETA
ncbi:MAG: HK97-gp10 family putative phage morphogenesis protein [Betaproteobacteria bacterium]